MGLLAQFISFIAEREAIRKRRAVGTRAALGLRNRQEVWTDDPILAEWKFCNVRREDDRVTRWITENWRTPNAEDPDLWFAMVVARFINWPNTLEYIGYPVPWRRDDFLEAMSALKFSGKKMYTGAYMVRADKEHKDKFKYQEKVVFTPLWEGRERLRPKVGDTLNSYHMLLGQFHGLGSFMAAQVVADLKYVSPLREASDWNTFAASGPGSRRGLNRVLGRDKDSPWTEENWRAELVRLAEAVAPHTASLEWEPLHNQDLQNCLCEFDKYMRVLTGEGRPRAKFP